MTTWSKNLNSPIWLKSWYLGKETEHKQWTHRQKVISDIRVWYRWTKRLERGPKCLQSKNKQKPLIQKSHSHSQKKQTKKKQGYNSRSNETQPRLFRCGNILSSSSVPMCLTGCSRDTSSANMSLFCVPWKPRFLIWKSGTSVWIMLICN